MTPTIQIAQRTIGGDAPVFVIAELSANHGQSFEQAVRLVQAAKEAGADAVKLQTYTPETITLCSNREQFRIGGGTLWDGRTLYDLYNEAYMPWEWQPKLMSVAEELGMVLFSSPFDLTAVDFLEQMQIPAYKLASFELIDIPLIQAIAATRKPLIISTGMGTIEEIEEAVSAARQAGAKELALLRCTSSYPAQPEDANLRTLPALAEKFRVPVGLSDHTTGIAVPVAAVALGATVIEKHLTLSRSMKGPDSTFSLEPNEFKSMVEAVRIAERSLGKVQFGGGAREESSRAFRRSLFVVANMSKGEQFTAQNVRSIRPAHGLHTRYLGAVLGKQAACDIDSGTPLRWELVKSR